MNLTAELCEIFLNQFNYCNSQGKRSYELAWYQFSLNADLTAALEKLAMRSRNAIAILHSDALQNNKENMAGLITVLEKVLTHLEYQRLRFGVVFANPGHRGRVITSIPRVVECIYKRAGRFEQEMMEVLTQMRLKTSQVAGDRDDYDAIDGELVRLQDIITNRPFSKSLNTSQFNRLMRG